MNLLWKIQISTADFAHDWHWWKRANSWDLYQPAAAAAEEKSHLVAQVPHALLPQLLSAYDQSSRLLRVTL